MSQISYLQLQFSVGRRFKTEAYTPWPRSQTRSGRSSSLDQRREALQAQADVRPSGSSGVVWLPSTTAREPQGGRGGFWKDIHATPGVAFHAV